MSGAWPKAAGVGVTLLFAFGTGVKSYAQDAAQTSTLAVPARTVVLEKAPARKTPKKAPARKIVPKKAPVRKAFSKKAPAPVVVPEKGPPPKEQKMDGVSLSLIPVADTPKTPSVEDWASQIDRTFVPIVWVSVCFFFGLRLLSWWVRRQSKREHPIAELIRRGWPLFEGLVWLGVALWSFTRVEHSEAVPTSALAGVVLVILVLALWNVVRDVGGGLILAGERPFRVGDFVRVKDTAGQVKSFRARVLELETLDGHRVHIPYREVVGMVDVRRGGRRTAHAVALQLDLPQSVEPAEALTALRELAASSPWTVLGVPARLELRQDDQLGRPCIELEAYAFDKEATVRLHADLLGGWRQLLRRWGESGASAVAG